MNFFVHLCMCILQGLSAPQCFSHNMVLKGGKQCRCILSQSFWLKCKSSVPLKLFLKLPWGNNLTLWLNEAMTLQSINRQPALSAGKLKLILSGWEYHVRFFALFHQVKFACHSGFMAVYLVGCCYEYTIIINLCLAYQLLLNSLKYGFIIFAAVCACLYFLFLCVIVFRVFWNIRGKRAAIPTMSRARQLQYRVSSHCQFHSVDNRCKKCE